MRLKDRNGGEIVLLSLFVDFSSQLSREPQGRRRSHFFSCQKLLITLFANQWLVAPNNVWYTDVEQNSDIRLYCFQTLLQSNMWKSSRDLWAPPHTFWQNIFLPMPFQRFQKLQKSSKLCNDFLDWNDSPGPPPCFCNFAFGRKTH